MSKTVEISIPKLRRVAAEALQAKGATSREAKAVVEDYLDADLRGRESHGFASFEVALQAFPKEGSFSVVKQTPTLLEIDGRGDCGHQVVRDAIDIGLEALEDTGTFTIGIRDIN